MKFPSISIGQEWKGLREFESLKENERKIVFYVENKASMNHFRTLIKEITEEKDLEICIVTSVKDDPILTSRNKKIKSFYIGEGAIRTKFFLTLKAKVLIMDMPDLETFHIKRSKVFSVHYIYLFHSMFSVHSYLRKGAVDNYDTIFCVGPHQVQEIKEIEKKYNLKPKKLIEYGFGRLDYLIEKKLTFENKLNLKRELIIIAPSYGENNLLEKCGEELIEKLLNEDFSVLLRPHFRTLKDSVDLIESIKNKFKNNKNFIFETGVIPFEMFYNSICLISDWSGISIEYPFAFERPVIFVDVPKKILNDEADKINPEPIEISIRNQLGQIVSLQEINKISDIVKSLKNNNRNFVKQISEVRKKNVFNIGTSAKIGASYIEEVIKK